VCVGWDGRLGFRCIGLHVSVTRHIWGEVAKGLEAAKC